MVDFWNQQGIEAENLYQGRGARKFETCLRVTEVGRNICYGGGKGGGGGGDAVDPQVGEAAKMTAQTGADWLNFAKEQFASGNVRQEKIDDLANQVSTANLKSMNDSNSRADAQWQRYLDVFQPAQDDYIKEATNWGSDERKADQAAQAKATVMTNAAAQQQANQRSMASMGVNPNSGRYAGVDRSTSLNTALASAGAQNSARTAIDSQALALKEGVANMAQGATSTSAQQLGLGLSSGNSATGTLNAANAQNLANVNSVGQAYSGAMSGYSNQANTLLNQQSQVNQVNANNSSSAAGLMSGIGSLVGSGAALYALSSKDYKENKEPIEGGLDAVNSMPVEQWNYKEGIGDEGSHIGPYAEDFQAATGKGDGTKIPIMDAVGVTMKAVQELSQKVDQLADGKPRKKNAMAGGI